jgi:hypothetical protein
MQNDITNLSILGWIFGKGVVNEKGEALDFKDRLFLLDILTDWSNEIVIKKCAQVGGSVTFNLKVLFAIKTFGVNAIYTFPTDDDVREFVSSKTNKLLAANKHVFGNIATDNIERKEIDNRFLFFKGTVSKTAAIMTSSDLNVHDEADRSNQPVLETYKSRLKASKFKWRWLFSNPTTDKGPIDLEWQKSDQKEWTISCTGCGLDQILTWPNSIDLTRKCYQCIGCKKQLTDNERRYGKWVAQRPGGKVSGYHISLLMAPWIQAAEVIEDSQGDQEYFYNFVLGEPYNPGDLRVSRSTILDNWTPRSLETGRWYLGVDVGNIKHYTLGSEKGITKIGKFSNWQDLVDILEFYKPITVIDAMPDNTMSRHFVENYTNVFMCFLNRDKSNNTVVKWDEKERGVIHADRNRLIDLVINEIINANILYGVASDFDFREYIKHWETLRRVKEVDTLGIERYIWESTTGMDHYPFATFFYYIARQASGAGAVIPSLTQDNLPKLIKETANGPVMGDIKELLELNKYFDD